MSLVRLAYPCAGWLLAAAVSRGHTELSPCAPSASQRASLALLSGGGRFLREQASQCSNWYAVTTATLCWPEQDTGAAQVQELGETEPQLLAGRGAV